MWIFWALLSALLAAVRRTNEKQLTHHLNHFTIAFATQLLSLPIILIALVLHGTIFNPFHLGINFWLPLLLVGVGFYPLNAFLYLQAIKHSELSKVLPLQSLWPVFSLIPAWLMLGEAPTPLAVVGIALTVVGVYVLGMKKNALHHPLRPFLEEKGSRYMLSVVMLITLVGVLEKIAVDASDAIYFSFVSTLCGVAVLYTTLRIHKVNERRSIRSAARSLTALGTFQGSSYIAFLLALSSGPVAYVSAIRSANILIGALLGIALLKEKLTAYKLVSFSLILGGIALLAVGSH